MPTIENELSYESGGSLRDHDIILFDPAFPWFPRVEFTGGGSCISIEGAARLAKHSNHWAQELKDALSSGKTVFLIMNQLEEDTAAIGSTVSGKNRNYQTQSVDNYSVLPFGLKVRNANGKKIIAKDQNYKPIHHVLSEIIEYKVVLEKSATIAPIFVAKDGTPVGGLMRFQHRPGAVVLLPYFDFEAEGFVEEKERGGVWTDLALKTSKAFVSQLVSIDKLIRGYENETPSPNWVSFVRKPRIHIEAEDQIADIDNKINELRNLREIKLADQVEINSYLSLLYGTGKPLERAIDKVLLLLGYNTENVRIGDLEIDHVIGGPSGVRMIGESEGKDSSAIDVSKFRQLESNIGEDFERDCISVPAKGLLFGNGYRLSPPDQRAEQFTQKCFINAKRLGSGLIRTIDLYDVAVWILDNPTDEKFKAACRKAIEDTSGEVVEFPQPRAH
ncbi:hypothetical protein [Brevundimonas nasdae]|uniref:Uncharacterized protein n=1 Tax=Brevundimonas nasdae TaxID=172043 RepID=A0ACD4VLC9_9CAUL|nr:hypothetical protein [Brevundimonas nasdae]WOB77836.1 hypothetical protein PZA08_10915 [Brevundimonas nasdae]